MFRRLVSFAPRAAQRSYAGPAIPSKLNHVAIAVPSTQNIKDAGKIYHELFGATVSEPVALPEHGVTTVFVQFGNTKIELLHPLGADSPIAGFLKKNPQGGMHHICIEVNNLEESIAKVRSLGVRTIGDKPKIGAHNKPVIFLHPKDCGGVLTEMEQV
eukprot:TRINITY_DN1154_c0_g1_i1.p2 TRINITY_DN1154_c0_g1~~TRINITY_DN1154_c0_g1_i1.p2  ORF type:complete len:158 (-),score=31.60 TRINITY_DN1154_c0_g1_i1:46-519(-)